MSNMVVQTNVLALNSHRNLKGVGILQQRASSRLSSGYRVNSAADDAAGLAISEKMRAQIRGLDMASKNAQDGISLIQTAEGGMQEIDNMLQRIRELVVQVSNDTNEHNDVKTGDRQKMQDEIDQLVAEIDSMSERVEFNKKRLISGDFADVAKQLEGAKLALKQAKEGAPSLGSAGLTAADKADLMVQYQTLRQSAMDIRMSVGELNTSALNMDLSVLVYKASATAMNNSANVKRNSAAIKDFSGTVKMGSANDMAKLAASRSLAADNKELIAKELEAKGGGSPATLAQAQEFMGSALAIRLCVNELTQSAANLKLSVDFIKNDANLMRASADLKDLSATIKLASADIKSVSATSMRELAADRLLVAETMESISDSIHKMVFGDPGKAAGVLKIEALSATVKALENADPGNKLYLQLGANAEQGILVSIGSMKSDVLGIGDGEGVTSIDVLQDTGLNTTGYLDVLDVALSYVTTERSKLGAAQNRLEYTMRSLDISSENLSAAESRVRDADMAKEMMRLTQANILQQSGVSMLAQANQAPQSILQLLR